MAFSKTNSTIDISTSQTIEANQTIEEVEETITTDDMMSYSWQIAQGMVSVESHVERGIFFDMLGGPVDLGPRPLLVTLLFVFGLSSV